MPLLEARRRDPAGRKARRGTHLCEHSRGGLHLGGSDVWSRSFEHQQERRAHSWARQRRNSGRERALLGDSIPSQFFLVGVELDTSSNVEGHRCFAWEPRSLNRSLNAAACPSQSVGRCGRCLQVARAHRAGDWLFPSDTSNSVRTPDVSRRPLTLTTCEHIPYGWLLSVCVPACNINARKACCLWTSWRNGHDRAPQCVGPFSGLCLKPRPLPL